MAEVEVVKAEAQEGPVGAGSATDSVLKGDPSGEKGGDVDAGWKEVRKKGKRPSPPHPQGVGPEKSGLKLGLRDHVTPLGLNQRGGVPSAVDDQKSITTGAGVQRKTRSLEGGQVRLLSGNLGSSGTSKGRPSQRKAVNRSNLQRPAPNSSDPLQNITARVAPLPVSGMMVSESVEEERGKVSSTAGEAPSKQEDQGAKQSSAPATTASAQECKPDKGAVVEECRHLPTSGVLPFCLDSVEKVETSSGSAVSGLTGEAQATVGLPALCSTLSSSEDKRSSLPAEGAALALSQQPGPSSSGKADVIKPDTTDSRSPHSPKSTGVQAGQISSVQEGLQVGKVALVAVTPMAKGRKVKQVGHQKERPPSAALEAAAAQRTKISEGAKDGAAKDELKLSTLSDAAQLPAIPLSDAAQVPAVPEMLNKQALAQKDAGLGMTGQEDGAQQTLQQTRKPGTGVFLQPLAQIKQLALGPELVPPAASTIDGAGRGRRQKRVDGLQPSGVKGGSPEGEAKGQSSANTADIRKKEADSTLQRCLSSAESDTKGAKTLAEARGTKGPQTRVSSLQKGGSSGSARWADLADYDQDESRMREGCQDKSKAALKGGEKSGAPRRTSVKHRKSMTGSTFPPGAVADDGTQPKKGPQSSMTVSKDEDSPALQDSTNGGGEDSARAGITAAEDASEAVLQSSSTMPALEPERSSQQDTESGTKVPATTFATADASVNHDNPVIQAEGVEQTEVLRSDAMASDKPPEQKLVIALETGQDEELDQEAQREPDTTEGSMLEPRKAWEEGREAEEPESKSQQEDEGFTGIPAPGEWGDAHFRQRLWSYLFENLNRATDELYFLCELECDQAQIAETVRVLAESVAHFKELAKRIHAFEGERGGSEAGTKEGASSKPSMRQSSAIAWEVRRKTGGTQQAGMLSFSLAAVRGPVQGLSTAKSSKQLGTKAGGTLSEEKSTGSSRAENAPSEVRQRTSTANALTIPKTKTLTKDSPQNNTTIYQASEDVPAKKTTVEQATLARLLAGLAVGKSLDSANSSMCSTLGSGSTSLRAINTSREVKTSSEGGAGAAGEGSVKSQSASSTPAWKEKKNWGDILSQQGTPMGDLGSLGGKLSGAGLFRRPPSVERARMLHDKLMSPERRKKTPMETKKEVEERQKRATRLRGELETEKRARLQKSAERASKVNEWQEIRRSKLSLSMEQRHQRSESRYEAHLAQIVRRAGDESCKVREVHFITSLNTEDKKLQLKQKLEESEARRQERKRLLQRRREEDLAREEEARERRKQLEAERQKRIAEAQKRKEEAAARREDERRKELAEREARKELQVARLEEQRRAAAEAAELLGQRLTDRLKESGLRRQVYLEQIRERAAVDVDRPLRRDGNSDSPYGKASPRRASSRGVSTRTSLVEKLGAGLVAGSVAEQPALETIITKAEAAGPASKKAGGVSEPSEPSGDCEVTETKSPESSRAVSAAAAAKEALKKRAKKIKQRLSARKHEWADVAEGSGTTTSTGRSKAAKWLLELQRQQAKGGSGAGLEAAAAELLKHLDTKESERHAARQAGLLDFTALALASKTPPPPPRASIALLQILRTLLTLPANRSYFIARNLLPGLIPLLTQSMARFSGGVEKGGEKVAGGEDSESPVLEGLLWVVAVVVRHMCGGDEKLVAMQEDLVELLVASGIVHSLRDLFALFDCPQAEGGASLPIPTPVLGGLQLLETLTGARGLLTSAHEAPVHTNKLAVAQSRAVKAVLEAVSETGLVSLPSLLTAVLLHAASGKVSAEQTAVALPPNFVEVATAVLRVLNNLARLDLKLLQSMLSLPDLRVEFFHLVSFLLSHCTAKWHSASDPVAGLLHETLLLIGYFALLHPGNQAVLRWGKEPTILQKLCELPFPYFSDPLLQPLLFGTVIAACYASDRNRDVVERELSMDMLQTFLKTSKAELPPVATTSDEDVKPVETMARKAAKPASESSSSQATKGRASRMGIDMPTPSPRGVNRLSKPGASLGTASPRLRSGTVTPSDAANPSPRSRTRSEGVAVPSPRGARTPLNKAAGAEQGGKKKDVSSSKEKGQEGKALGSAESGASSSRAGPVGAGIKADGHQSAPYLLHNRFPATLWGAAEQFFAVMEPDAES